MKVRPVQILMPNTSVGRALGGLSLYPSLVHHYGISPIQSQVLVLIVHMKFIHFCLCFFSVACLLDF